jgi:hypothetical protein
VSLLGCGLMCQQWGSNLRIGLRASCFGLRAGGRRAVSGNEESARRAGPSSARSNALSGQDAAPEQDVSLVYCLATRSLKLEACSESPVSMTESGVPVAFASACRQPAHPSCTFHNISVPPSCRDGVAVGQGAESTAAKEVFHEVACLCLDRGSADGGAGLSRATVTPPSTRNADADRGGSTTSLRGIEGMRRLDGGSLRVCYGLRAAPLNSFAR